jgi:hypothetical protein
MGSTTGTHMLHASLPSQQTCHPEYALWNPQVYPTRLLPLVLEWDGMGSIPTRYLEAEATFGQAKKLSSIMGSTSTDLLILNRVLDDGVAGISGSQTYHTGCPPTNLQYYPISPSFPLMSPHFLDPPRSVPQNEHVCMFSTLVCSL